MQSRLEIRTVGAMLLAALASCASTPRFAIHDDAARGVCEVHDGDALVLGYRYLPRDAASPRATERLACYAHPILGLDGEVLSAEFPADHVHHRGLSLMWPVVRRGGVRYDLWEPRGIRTVFGRWLARRGGEAHAQLELENHWVLDDGTRVCRERLRLTVHAAEARGRAIDVRYELTPLGEALALRGQPKNRKGYGGLTLRFLAAEDRADTRITTDGGAQKDRLDAPFAWADFSARMAGAEEASGIAVFPHPEHPDSPPRWMLRHYGLLNVAWPGRREQLLESGQSYELRYRLWVHRGDAAAGGVAEAYARYVAQSR